MTTKRKKVSVPTPVGDGVVAETSAIGNVKPKLLTATEFATELYRNISVNLAIRVIQDELTFPLFITYEYDVCIGSSGDMLYRPRDNILVDQLATMVSRWNARNPDDRIEGFPIYYLQSESLPSRDLLQSLGYNAPVHWLQEPGLRVDPSRPAYLPHPSMLALSPAMSTTTSTAYTIEQLFKLCSHAITLRASRLGDYNVMRGIFGPLFLVAGITKQDQDEAIFTEVVQTQLTKWQSMISRPIPNDNGVFDTMQIVQFMGGVSWIKQMLESIHEYVDDESNGLNLRITEDGAIDLNVDESTDLLKVTYMMDHDSEHAINNASIVGVELMETPMGSYWLFKFEQHSVIRGTLERVIVRQGVSLSGKGITIKTWVPDPASIALGKKLTQLVSCPAGINDPVHVMSHKGVASVPGMFGPLPMFYNGPVIYDPIGCKQLETTTFNSLISDIEFLADAGDRTKGIQPSILEQRELTDFDYATIDNQIIGFMLDKQRWGTLNIKNVAPLVHDRTIFDKLVLDDGEKRNIRSIVSHLNTDFVDIVAGKGGGAIFLLYGPPGLGKTLTAEAVSAVSERVLYKVSVGELGTDVQSLERSLQRVLGYATRWNATLLFDEADIFLEKRDSHNIQRNAMVGVFLRLLEYYPGILFLTTNRVKNFDQAFFSRITYAIGFKEQTLDQRKKVWYNLLTSAKLSVSDVELATLAAFDVNNRQVKTSITNAQRFAASDGVGVGFNHLLASLKGTSQFNQEITDMDDDVVVATPEPVTLGKKIRQFFS